MRIGGDDVDSENGGLDRGFESQIPQTTAEIRHALGTGLVSLDANVLLSFYRFSPTAQTALTEVLRALGDRLWVSHQAVREFWRNRCAAIDGRNRATESVQQSLEENVRKLLQAVDTWAKQTAVPSEIRDEVKGELTSGFARAVELIEGEASGGGQATYAAETDAVVATLRAILQAKVGPPLDPEDRAMALKEAKRRLDARVPPGYLDAAKEVDGGADGGAGDYLVWHQSILEAKRRGLPLVIVTGDEKEDWWWRHRTTFLGPRSELVDEFSSHSDQGFCLLRPVQLIEHADSLHVAVSEEAAAEVQRGTTDPSPASWSAEAVHELLKRLDAEGREQADVIRHAANEGGRITREKIYEIGGYDQDRMLRGFTRPAARVTRDLQREGLLDDGVEPILTPMYEGGVTAVRFEVPPDVVEILSAASERERTTEAPLGERPAS